jgi:cytochrome P450
MRTTLDDVELAGVLISAGTLVIVNTAAANRDPAAYEAASFLLTATFADQPATSAVAGGVHHGPLNTGNPPYSCPSYSPAGEWRGGH